MTTVFLSGSRGISRLNDKIRDRVKNMMDKEFRIIVGDASGADKALQEFLFDLQYSNVVVFCSGQNCRNNVGNWNIRQVDVDAKLTGRAFYTQKDKEMASEADYGFILWDGKSVGSISNVLELLKREKSIVVYFAPDKIFCTISRLDDARELLKRCDRKAIDAMQEKIELNTAIGPMESTSQGVLSF